jgi:hypothetical protein
MAFANESVTVAGSGLVFVNSYDATVSAAYKSAILTAENYLQSHFTDSITINATLTGGAGADTFHSFSGAGLDVVTDFNAGEGDRVQLDAGASYTVAQQGADVVINLGGTDEMVLKNVTLSALPSGWIFTQ